MASESFTTLRLSAHRPTEPDFAVLRSIHTDAGTMKTLSVDGSIPTEKESRVIFDRHLRHWDEHEFGVWLFSDTSTKDSIGYCGLRKYRLDGRVESELFYGVHSRYFRMGYGFEMASAVVGIGFKEIYLQSIISFTLEDNSASRALMVKLGMDYVGIIEHAGLPHVMYRVSGPGG